MFVSGKASHTDITAGSEMMNRYGMCRVKPLVKKKFLFLMKRKTSLWRSAF